MDSITTNWLAQWAHYSPERVAFEEGETGRQFRYAEANNIVDFLAHQFCERFQIKTGDRICVLASNFVEYVFLLPLAQRLGALLVPINFRLAAPEIAHILNDSEPQLLIVESGLEDRLAPMQQTAKPPHILSFDGPKGYTSLVADAQKSKPSRFQQRSQFDDPCLILYTSGTTGTPKGAVLSNKALFWNSINTSLRLNISQNDVTVTFLPFFHTGGWNVLTTPFLHRGGHVIFLKKFDPDKILEICEKRKVSILFGVPTTMDMMAHSKKFADTDLSSVRYAIVGGEPMPVDLIRTWDKKGVAIRQGYGLTEFGPNVFSLNEEDAIRKIGSIGFANFYIDTRVVDNDGLDVDTGEVGELLLRGPMAMKEYWRNPEATRKTVVDGWLHTGDLVKTDEDGYFYVVGRKKEMFISGGENVYPAEVEQALHEIDGVREVAVIGTPDEKWGEVGRAFVVLEKDLSPDELTTQCLQRLAKFKIPKHFEFIEELPKGDSGKILKRQLAARPI